ncbi:MAG: ribonuclease HII, partial [Candidatus Aenigmarchaeota archaeon]|nr:ribonuclease HII [Candidatus Aenigmarchaeota archaeon]
GYVIDSSQIDELKKMGVKDSKLLAPKRREYLESKLKEMSEDIIVIKLNALDIDNLRSETNLNKIEIKRMQDIINSVDCDKVFIDAIEANVEKFRKEIISGLSQDRKELIKKKKLEIICENYADKNYPVVGAASIIAKVARDADIELIHKEYGDFGSGYSSDPRTVKFLKDWIKKNKKYPPFVRGSWITAKEIKKDNDQKRIKEFIIKESDIDNK